MEIRKSQIFHRNKAQSRVFSGFYATSSFVAKKSHAIKDGVVKGIQASRAGSAGACRYGRAGNVRRQVSLKNAAVAHFVAYASAAAQFQATRLTC